MIARLQPMILSSWHGHRDDDLPEVVREVWRRKFNGGGSPAGGRQSNVDLAIVDSSGRLVHAFDAFPHPAGPASPRESLGAYTARELDRARSQLELHELVDRPAELTLPDVARGARVFVSLLDDRMTAYRAPVVEVVAMGDGDWARLAWPRVPRSIEARELGWLFQIYPPGVMERTDPDTKVAYRIRAVAGTLTLEPAGSDQAVLRGRVELTDEGPDPLRYSGALRVALSYVGGRTTFLGVFEGSYPRPVRQGTRDLPLVAAIESRP